MIKLFAQPVAHECPLQLCVCNMRAEFTNGTLYETETSTWTNQSQSQTQPNTDISLHLPGSSATFIATKEAVQATAYWLSSLLIGNASRPALFTGLLHSPNSTTVLNYEHLDHRIPRSVREPSKESLTKSSINQVPTFHSRKKPSRRPPPPW